MLEVRSLTAGYGRALALTDATLTVPDGSCVAVLGNNGAGKTTLLRSLSGLVRPRSGSVTFNGVDLSSASARAFVDAGIAHVPEGRQVFADLTVEENLTLGSLRRRDRAEIRRDRDRVLGLFPRLGERLAQRAGTMSGGEQQMLVIARGLMAKPSLLLIDEPSLGLSPRMVKEIFEIVGQVIREERVSVLLVEQNARLALHTAGYAYVLRSGRIVSEGGSQSLLDNENTLHESYLGQVGDEPYSRTAGAN